MKIGIVGLRPRQVQDVRSRDIELDIEYLTVKEADPHRVECFSRDKDKVVLMVGHVGRVSFEQVPTSKRQLINGSVSALVRWLEEEVAQLTPATDKEDYSQPWHSDMAYLPGGDVVDAEWGPVGDAEVPRTVVKVELVEQTVDSKASEEKSVPTPVKIARQVPEGRRSQYLLPKSDILINYPNSGGVQDYRILLAAIPGDVVRFARPEGLPLGKWRNRINAIRTWYWKRHGILLEAHLYEEYLDLQVMRTEEDVVPKNALNLTVTDVEVVEEKTPLNPPRDMGQTDIYAVEKEGVPVTREIPHRAPTPPVSTLMDAVGGDVLKGLAVSGALPPGPVGPPPLPEALVKARQGRLRRLIDVDFDGIAQMFAGRIQRSSAQVNAWLDGDEMSTFQARTIEDIFELPRGWMSGDVPLGENYAFERTQVEQVEEEEVRLLEIDLHRTENVRLVIREVFHGSPENFAKEIGVPVLVVMSWMHGDSVSSEHARQIEQTYGLDEFELDTPLEQKAPVQPAWPIMRGSVVPTVEPTPIAPEPEEEDVTAEEEETVSATPPLKAPKEAMLWRDVLVAAVRYGQEVDVAIDDADEALEAYRARFGA